MYKCDGIYNKESELGIKYNDPILKIDWQISESEAIVSEKDQQLPGFVGLETGF
jgi:dTDP-4-dehydrorhamnose 3,5-epimerase